MLRFMQKVKYIIIFILLLAGTGANSQDCPKCDKYTNSMHKGKQYLINGEPDSALIEFRAAQIAARECKCPSQDPGKELDTVFLQLKKQKDSAEKDKRVADSLKKVAVEAYTKLFEQKKKSDRLLKLLFKNEKDKVTWCLDNRSGKYGMINKDGEVLGEKFVWENPVPLNDSLTIAKRNEKIYIINESGECISDGYYRDIVKTEFPGLYFAFDDYYGNKGKLIFYDGQTFQSLLDARSDFDIEKDRQNILPYMDGKRFYFKNKLNKRVLPSGYDEIKTFEAEPIFKMAAHKGNKWDFIDSFCNKRSFSFIIHINTPYNIIYRFIADINFLG